MPDHVDCFLNNRDMMTEYGNLEEENNSFDTQHCQQTSDEVIRVIGKTEVGGESSQCQYWVFVACVSPISGKGVPVRVAAQHAGSIVPSR